MKFIIISCKKKQRKATQSKHLRRLHNDQEDEGRYSHCSVTVVTSSRLKVEEKDRSSSSRFTVEKKTIIIFLVHGPIDGRIALRSINHHRRKVTNDEHNTIIISSKEVNNKQVQNCTRSSSFQVCQAVSSAGRLHDTEDDISPSSFLHQSITPYKRGDGAGSRITIIDIIEKDSLHNNPPPLTAK